MKQEKRKMIIEYARKNELTNREDLIALLDDDLDIPKYDELAKRYKANIIAQLIATVRDEEGRRWILAKRSAEDVQFVNLEKCNNTELLKSIRKRIMKDITGRSASLRKVDIQIEAVQIKVFDYMKESEVFQKASTM